MKVGLGQADITPPVGTPMAGYGRREGSTTGVHDPLYSRSAVFTQGRVAAALMAVSVVYIPHDLVEQIRLCIHHETGIPAENIALSATHTHSGPDLTQAREDYRRLFVERCTASAVTAWKSRVPARIGAGAIITEDVGYNSRRLLYGGVHPDPQVLILKVEDTRGDLLGVLFNYGCHPSTLDLHNLQISEDWPFYAIQGIQECLGKAVWVAFFQGPEGDTKIGGYCSELSAVGADIPIRNWAYAERKGRRLSEAVLQSLPHISTCAQRSLRCIANRIDLPLRTHFADSLEQARSKEAEASAHLSRLEAKSNRGETIGRRILDQARVNSFLATLNLETAVWFYSSERQRFRNVELQAIGMDDAVFMAWPGEVFSEIGLSLRRASPYSHTFILGLSGASAGVGYLPTLEEFREGGYEVLSSRFSENAAAVLIESSLRLLHRLRTDNSVV